MCDNCFISETPSFPDEKTWISFDFELTKKLGQGKMKIIKFVNDRQREKDDGEYIYQCLSCGENWKLRDPDNAFRGYFLKLSTVDKIVTRTIDPMTVLKVGLILLLLFLTLWIIENWN